MFDALNDTRNLETAVKAVKKTGKHAQGTVCYTLSPVHTLEHYLDIVRRLVELNCDSICIKDMAGLLSPKDAYELITAFKKESGLPVQLHCHYTSGMALMTYLRACDADVDVLDTAFSSLAGGTSPPPVETIAAAFQVTKDCDCMAKNQKGITDDIGILASLDPVAVDQATADLLVARAGGKDPLRAGYDIDWSGQLAHGEKIGLGSRKYSLVEIS